MHAYNYLSFASNVTLCSQGMIQHTIHLHNLPFEVIRVCCELPPCTYPPPPPQAISNPNNEKHQEAAWKQVGPLVQMLRRFYEYALELETALCRLLSVLCSPEMSAIQHLASQQVQLGRGWGVGYLDEFIVLRLSSI